MEQVEENDGSSGVGYKVVMTASRTASAGQTNHAYLALYQTDVAPDAREAPKWSAMEVFIECEPTSTEDDPFDESAKDFRPSSERRKGDLAQIMAHASLIFDKQHRTHLYTVVLFGEMARILRWDRSGVIATKKFNYRQEPVLLSRFFCGICRMSAAERGHDTTVEEVPRDSADYALMRERGETPRTYGTSGIELGQHARLLFFKSFEDGETCYRIRTSGGRFFLVGAPRYISSTLAGRGTRGYVAIDSSDPTGAFVYLKDAWRIDGIEREGSILQDLNEKNVDGVPTLVYDGDVEGQVTDSQDVWKDQHPCQRDQSPLKTHRHYRLVVQEVGLSMSHFRNAKELVTLVTMCIIAHRNAYNVGVTHRDVSSGNVLIHIKETIVEGKLVQTRVGLLIDWELSKRNDTSASLRLLDRVGTWQFMSVYTLNHPSAAISIPDEIEAFFHVLLYYAIRFLRHNCDSVGPFMLSYFDDFTRGDGGVYCGRTKAAAMELGKIRLANRQDLTFHLPPDAVVADDLADGPDAASSSASQHPAADPKTTHPLNLVLDALLDLFRARYALLSDLKTAVEDPPPTTQRAVPSADKLDLWWSDEGVDAMPAAARKKVASSEDEVKAMKLASHDAIKDMLRPYFKHFVWPEEDKIDDQLRKGWDPNKEDRSAPARDSVPIPTAVSQGAQRQRRSTRLQSQSPLVPTANGSSSTKRSMTEEGAEEMPVPKRRRGKSHKGERDGSLLTP
ncbi:hypothetical protein K466DRAFT_524948 [Polyporus arcularius HHB13444]|uniref:Fungal-type protein kinase domain-containing protein n=1 Tax=Polyporus arcularius HHB13444 TaxID=1314778 RepID=A0A5C3P942_9APHY|nr:hypothetical protein K466DRAFT_524948 [Polyporus arcularius HHB13444]